MSSEKREGRVAAASCVIVRGAVLAVLANANHSVAKWQRTI